MISFVKYQGTGNDFILIDDRSLSFDSKLVAPLCHRKFGIGADGVILLQPTEIADFRMRIFNRDGTEAESCGNGLRCLGRFITDLGFSEKIYSIATHDRVVQLSYHSDQIRVSMGKAKDLRLHIPTEYGPVHFVDTGVPHAVFFVADVHSAPLDQLGPFFRRHPTFGPLGANVNLASPQPDGSIHVRTFERGVEGETLACGTGACAVATVIQKLYPHQNSNPMKLFFPGGVLEISIDQEQLFMVGPAKKVFSGLFSEI